MGRRSMKVVERLPHLTKYNWKYPWDLWTDGRVWELMQGVDFQPTLRNFRPQCSMIATRRGLRYRSHSPDGPTGKRIQIQFYRA